MYATVSFLHFNQTSWHCRRNDKWDIDLMKNSNFHLLFRAVKAFQQVLWVEPGFPRACEVHLRLGLMLKVHADFDAALKHLTLALIDATTPASFSKLESEFLVLFLSLWRSPTRVPFFVNVNSTRNSCQTYTVHFYSRNLTLQRHMFAPFLSSFLFSRW